MGLKLNLRYEAPPQFVSAGKVRLEILNVLRGYGVRIKHDFEITTRYFDHDVDFTVQKRFGANVASIEVGTDDSIYEMLNDGTPIRFNVMTKDFVPKTHVGSLLTVPGKGGFAYIDKKKPRPGIQARGWTDIIAERNEDEMVADITDAIIKGFD